MTSIVHGCNMSKNNLSVNYGTKMRPFVTIMYILKCSDILIMLKNEHEDFSMAIVHLLTKNAK